MRRVRTIRGFVDLLARTDATGRSFNQYAPDAEGSARKRANLRRYLGRMHDLGTKMILVGEAPSYRGGRLTGIPFLSEKIMLQGHVSVSFLGAENGYLRATKLPRLSTEASATMVWETVGPLEPPPLLWNAYPFHPFHEGNQESNRAPTRREIEIGQPFLEALLEIFAIETVIAVGNHADRTLSQLAIPHEKVRHPSNGGKNQFVKGIRTICRNLE